MAQPSHETMLKLKELQEHLQEMMQPEVLRLLTEFLDKSPEELLKRYEWFVKNSEHGKDCRYAQIAKNIFASDFSSQVKDVIVFLYKDFASK